MQVSPAKAEVRAACVLGTQAGRQRRQEEAGPVAGCRFLLPRRRSAPRAFSARKRADNAGRRKLGRLPGVGRVAAEQLGGAGVVFAAGPGVAVEAGVAGGGGDAGQALL